MAVKFAKRAAIAGTGFMGWVHLEALRRIGVDVVGVLGSTPEKGERFRVEHNLPRAYESWQQLLDDEEAVVVHLATPNRLHFQGALETLQAGKHVLCEKPLAMNAEESATLTRQANSCPDQLAAVNYNMRFYPLCWEARQRIRTGEIGRLFHVTGSYVQDWLLRESDFNWRVLADEGGPLRAVADIGTHWLDLIYFLTGLEVAEVLADSCTVHPERIQPDGNSETFQAANPSQGKRIGIATEDFASILIRFSGGVRGSLHVSQVCAGRKNCLQFEVAGSDHSLAWNSESPNELTIGCRDEANQRLIRDPALLHADAATWATYPGGHNEGYADSFKQCFRSFYDFGLSGDYSHQPPFATFADGHREIVLCEAILSSLRSGTWTSVESAAVD